ncbi:hypothetical protein ACTOXX_05005 [Streptomyces rubiginosohelvolus]|uniref:hypothetical protein n=1 Tax=Streptomyces rubiginosohelvolus TaxID=67362 RepID=UPI003422C1C4
MILGAAVAASGKPVEVVSERTEYSVTEAEPERALALTRSAPEGAVVDLPFSGGAAENQMPLLADGRDITLVRSGSLPELSIDGPMATCPNVSDGIDLHLTATAEGYGESWSSRRHRRRRTPASTGPSWARPATETSAWYGKLHFSGGEFDQPSDVVSGSPRTSKAAVNRRWAMAPPVAAPPPTCPVG